MSPDERYITIDELEPGQRFIYKDETEVMKLPPCVECFGEKANVVNLKTGTMLWLKPTDWVDQQTWKVALSI